MKLNHIALIVGVCASLIFVIYALVVCKNKLRLEQVIPVLLSWTGGVACTHLGYLTLFEDDAYFGKLADHRLYIFLGAFTAVWTAGMTFIGSVKAQSARQE